MNHIYGNLKSEGSRRSCREFRVQNEAGLNVGVPVLPRAAALELHSRALLYKTLGVGMTRVHSANVAETLLIVITYISCWGASQPPYTYIGRRMIEPWGHHGAFLTIFEF